MTSGAAAASGPPSQSGRAWVAGPRRRLPDCCVWWRWMGP